MEYEFKGCSNTNWHAIQYANYINIQTSPYYEDKDNLLDLEDHPTALENAYLMAASPKLLEACKETLELISSLYRREKPINDTEYSHIQDILTSAIHKALNV
jgi:hypothetical protein